MSNVKDTYCSLRWDTPSIDLEDGSVRVCCRTPRRPAELETVKKYGPDAIFNTPYLLERRAEMLKGIKHPDCHNCWDAEAKGIPSPRSQSKSPSFKIKNLNEPIPQEILRADSVNVLEIQLGITCDLKCVYCWYGNSSSWLNEDYHFGSLNEEEFKKLKNRVLPEFEPVFWQWFEKVGANAQVISFVGGEPTASPKFTDVLKKITNYLKSQNSKTPIRIVTNLNCSESRMKDFLNILQETCKTTDVYVDISMESFEERAEFIRFGLKWKTFERNLDALLSMGASYKNLQISILASLNALCVSSFNSFLHFLNEKQINTQKPIYFVANSVIAPNWLALGVLTNQFLKYFDEIASSLRSFEKKMVTAQKPHFWGEGSMAYVQFIEQLRQTLLTPDPQRDQLQADFFKNIKKLEYRRNVQFLKIFPEYRDFFEICEKKYLALSASKPVFHDVSF